MNRPIKELIQIMYDRFGGLKDKSGTLISDHAIRVASYLEFFLTKHLIQSDMKQNIIIAGLFHDVLEDTNTTVIELEQITNKIILKLVQELTINFENKTFKEVVQPLYNISDESYIVKLADIFDNTKKSYFFIQNNTFEWFENFYFPLLSEYESIIKKRKINNFIYKLLVVELSDLVLKEMSLLRNTINFNRKYAKSLIEIKK